MAENKLTARQIKAQTGKLFDGGGLYLKKTGDTGRWSYRYDYMGRTREMGLGPYPDVSLAAARAERDQWRAVLRSGADPIETRKRRQAEAAAERSKTDPTFEEAAQITLEAKKAGLRGGGRAGRWMSPLSLHVIPKIGHRRMTEIHQSDIHEALAPIWRKMPPTAEKAIQRTRIIFQHMRLSGVDCDPFTVDMAKHMLGEVNHKPQPIAASDWRKIPEIYAKLDGVTSSRLALRLIILTLARQGSARPAQFSEFEGDVWTIPAERMKGREGKVSDFRTPLSSEAMRVVDEARAWQRSAIYLFPGDGGGFVSEAAIAKVFRKVDPSGTPHGLRTSFRMWVQETQAASFDVAETQLAHIVGNKVERAYARSDLLDPRRLLMEAWARFVTGASENVIELAGRK